MPPRKFGYGWLNYCGFRSLRNRATREPTWREVEGLFRSKGVAVAVQPRPRAKRTLFPNVYAACNGHYAVRTALLRPMACCLRPISCNLSLGFSRLVTFVALRRRSAAKVTRGHFSSTAQCVPASKSGKFARSALHKFRRFWQLWQFWQSPPSHSLFNPAQPVAGLTPGFCLLEVRIRRCLCGL